MFRILAKMFTSWTDREWDDDDYRSDPLATDDTDDFWSSV
jgi:hypothetical protein